MGMSTAQDCSASLEMLIPAAGKFPEAVQRLKTFNPTLKRLPVWGEGGRGLVLWDCALGES